MNDPTTVLVTGASGFIAKHGVLERLTAGYRVVGSVRSDARRGSLVVPLRRVPSSLHPPASAAASPADAGHNSLLGYFYHRIDINKRL